MAEVILLSLQLPQGLALLEAFEEVQRVLPLYATTLHIQVLEPAALMLDERGEVADSVRLDVVVADVELLETILCVGDQGIL